MRDPFIKELHDKYYANKNKKGDKQMATPKVKTEVKNGEVKKKVVIEKKIAEVKKEKKARFKTRPNGVLRLSDKHMGKFGFKAKQELEIVNTKPGEITIRAKNGSAVKEVSNK